MGTAGGGLYNFSNNLQIPFNNTNAALIAPTNAVQGAGATLGLAFLSDLEVYFFLTAAQGDSRTNVLQAPKVTTFNGALATIVNAELQWYVAALTPIVGPGSVAFVPTPAPLPNGVILTVTPVVSADRRYVRMTLSPIFNTIDGFTTIQVPAAVGGSGLGGGAATINATLQLPQTNTTTVSTTVTVPDGGTVLLGGVKRLNEERTGVRRAGPVQDPLDRPPLPQRRNRPREHELDAHGHAPHHHPRRGRRTAGDPVHRHVTG